MFSDTKSDRNLDPYFNRDRFSQSNTRSKNNQALNRHTRSNPLVVPDTRSNPLAYCGIPSSNPRSELDSYYDNRCEDRGSNPSVKASESMTSSRNPTFSSQLFGAGEVLQEIEPRAGAGPYRGNKKLTATYSSSIFDENQDRNRGGDEPIRSKRQIEQKSSTIFGEADPNEVGAEFFGKGKKSEELCRYEMPQPMHQEESAELISSDGHAAPCHRRRGFPERRYQSNIRRLGADDMPQQIVRMQRHTDSRGVAASLRMNQASVSPQKEARKQSSYSQNPIKAIYPTANFHVRKTVPHEQTPYASSKEFLQMRASECADGVPEEASVPSEAVGQAPISRSTLLDHSDAYMKDDSGEPVRSSKRLVAPTQHIEPEADLFHVGHGISGGVSAVPRKNIPLMIHQPPSRSSYSRQVVTRYEADYPNPGACRTQDLFN